MFDYNCIECGKQSPKNHNKMSCMYCGGELRGTAPAISTTDTFGFDNKFTDEKTGKEIDSYKKWEKAGFGDVSNIKNHELKERVKEKKAKRNGKKENKISNSSLPI